MRYAMKNYFVALAFTALFLPVACACGTPEPRPQRGRGSPAREPRGKELQEPGFPGIPRGRPHGNTRRGREFLPLCDRERKEQHPHPALVRPGELDEGRLGLYGGEPSADNRQGRGQPLGAGPQQDRRSGYVLYYSSRGRTISTPSAWRRAPRLSGPLPTTGN